MGTDILTKISEVWNGFVGFMTRPVGSPNRYTPDQNERRGRGSNSVSEILKSPPPFKPSYRHDMEADLKSNNTSHSSESLKCDGQETVESVGEEALFTNLSENDTSHENQEKSAFSDLLKSDIFLKISTDLLLFFQDRLLGLDELPHSDVQWVIRAVDLLDEMQMMNRSYSENDSQAVNFIKDKILEDFSKIKVVIIDKDTWDGGNEQRAISVKRSPLVSVEKIEKKLSSGIIMNGALIRKQEVFLIIPEKQTGDAQC